MYMSLHTTLHSKKEEEHPATECDFFKSISQILRWREDERLEIDCIHHTTQLFKYELKSDKVKE
jgi:hypothetical protein